MSLRGPRFEDIKAALLPRLEQLARELAPNGRRNGKYWMFRAPWRDDRRPGCWIRLDCGAWEDPAIGLKGDVFKFIAEAAGLRDARQVRKWALAWLGWSDGAPPPVRPAVRATRAMERQRQALLKEQEKLRKRAMASWLDARKDWRGGPLEKYLAETRGIDLAALGTLPGALRLIPSARHVESGRSWPVMAAAMTFGNGTFAALHRTFLTPDGIKAPVRPVKKIWPSGYQGSVIRLSKGQTRLSPEKAAAAERTGPVVICEGIETGLSIACACPHLRVWAAGTLGNMAHVSDHPCASGWILAHDHLKAGLDEEQRQRHLRLLASIREHFEATGKPVTEVFSDDGNDFNDQIRRRS